GPAAAGVELGRRVEQRLVTAHTVVDAGHIAIVVLAAKRTLGGPQPADLKLLRSELRAPVIQVLVDFFHEHTSPSQKSPLVPLPPIRRAAYDSSPVCHPRHSLPRPPRAPGSASYFGITFMQVSKSNKLANVCYDIRGPVLKHAKRLED